jgi:hypothetical protein
MPQIFHRSFNTLALLSILGAVGAVVAGSAVLYEFFFSPWATAADEVVMQTVPFSHQHHVGVLKFDCRYCHTSVETSGFAGIPPTKTCMNCHSQIWVGSEMLEPVRESYRTGQSLHWNRVYNLQQFAYFDHSIHVNKGVGCVTCHGRVDQMPLLSKANSLLMQWCLDCHRDPEPNLRPRDQITSMTWEPEGDRRELGHKLAQEYKIRDARDLTSCSTCHR